MNFVIFYVLASFEFVEPGGVSTSMVVTCALVSPQNAVFANPAMLAQLNGYDLSFSCTQPYAVAGLTSSQIAVNLKKPVNLGLGVMGLGTEGYEEATLSLGTAFSFSPELSYGFALQGLYLSVAGYGRDLVPAFDLGVVWNKQKYSVGFVIDNLNQPRNSAGDELPAKIGLGAVVKPAGNLKLALDVIREKNLGERLSAGAEFELVPLFALRLGFGTNPFLVAIGAGAVYKSVRVDYACRFHPRLKETHLIGLGICLK